MKKRLCCALLCVMLAAACLPARAGEFWSITVATEGDGAQVYSSPRGAAVGVLFNGYNKEVSGPFTEKGSFWAIDLTEEYTVWVNPVTAGSLYPDSEQRTEGWENQLPFDAFLGEVREDSAVMRVKPDKRSRLIAWHAAGSQFMVWGEFGAYYYVQTGSGYGFMSKSDIFEALAPEKSKPYAKFHSWNWPYLEERTVYTDGSAVFASDSAARFSEKTERFSGTVLKQNDTVRIRTYLPGGWAQLQNGFFLETRYLEPDGNHAPARTARVKTTSLASRLNVRSGPDSQSPVAVKLCSGTLVEVVSQTDEWAVIGLSGTNGAGVLGCVQKKYLEFEPKKQVADGSVLARVTEELSGSDYYRPAAKTIPAGSSVRIVGVSDGYDITRPEEGDLYVILDEEGGLYWVGDNTGCFEPLEYPALKATASAAAPMRAHPRMDGEVLVKIPSGAKLEVLLRGEGFSMVRYKGQTGYVLTRQIRFR